MDPVIILLHSSELTKHELDQTFLVPVSKKRRIRNKQVNTAPSGYHAPYSKNGSPPEDVHIRVSRSYGSVSVSGSHWQKCVIGDGNYFKGFSFCWLLRLYDELEPPSSCKRTSHD
ncbi:hypothetical protein L798_10122 [Zootermopsis nevadensis]|uniref:Uncharacterized protein n=1 Tax=Zootermopsis nevadensis TaxID=136037 RepID=A0A067R0N5_ZOONE|nr:hypothetical protein L798_10122 [Zootermopsis nevadensis]